MKKLSTIIIILTTALSLCSCKKTTSFKEDKKTYLCKMTESPITIDGNINEKTWQQAEQLWPFWRFVNNVSYPAWNPVQHSPSGKIEKALMQTRVKLLYDKEYLYIAAKMDDKDLFTTMTEKDSGTWSDDVFELFIKPDQNDHRYYEFHTTASNVILDASYVRRGRQGIGIARAYDSGMKTAVKIKGTLNNISDKDEGWSVEIKIPLKSIKPVKKGNVWLFLAARYNFSKHLPDNFFFGYEKSSTSKYLLVQGFHFYENYHYLKFE
ncbi:MAG: carbohydrate-binding family 9-like protein [Planctomycetota bacterium]